MQFNDDDIQFLGGTAPQPTIRKGEDMKKISIVVPCYNEEACVKLYYSKIYTSEFLYSSIYSMTILAQLF